MPAKFLSDTGENVGNSPGSDNRGRIHTKISNTILEPIPVSLVNPIPPSNQTVTFIYNGITNVATSVISVLLSYTVPASKTFYISRIEISGTNIALYTCQINSSIVGIKRTWFGEGLNEAFDFSSSTETGILLNTGDTVTVDVEHFRPDLGDFDATLVGLIVG